MHSWHHTASALLAGADRNLLPLLGTFRQTLGIEFDAAALGKQRGDLGHTELYRLLNGEIHPVTTGNALT